MMPNIVRESHGSSIETMSNACMIFPMSRARVSSFLTALCYTTRCRLEILLEHHPSWNNPSLTKIFRLQFDGFSVRCSVRRALPGLVMLRQSLRRGRAFFGDHAFERREPMMIISFAGVGIAGGLRLSDLLAEHRGPLVPGEQTFLM